MRLRVRLEYERGEWSVIAWVDLHRPVDLCADERVQLLHLVRSGHQLDQLRKQCLRAVGEIGRAAEEREELLPLHRLLHCIQRVSTRDLFAAEVALEEDVVGCGNRL